jgi:hypothetical protein
MGLQKLTVITALVFFLIETVLFGMYYLTLSTDIIFISYFIGIIILIISIILGCIIIFSKNSTNIKLKSCSVILLNILIAGIYSYFVILLTDYARITLINSTSDKITDIQILGCKEKYLDILNKGDKKTIWIKITEDCSIDINYIFEGTKKRENIIEYISPGMGEKIDFSIE